MASRDKSKKVISEELRLKRSLAGKIGGANKRGTMSLKKVNQLKVKSLIFNRLHIISDKLINAQIIAATGTHRMVTLETDEEGKKHVRQVRDEARMQNLLDTGIYGEDYFILAGADPDWKAAEALLNRGLGKAAETKTIDVKHSFNLTGLAKERSKLPPATLPAITQSKPIDTTYTEVNAPPSAI